MQVFAFRREYLNPILPAVTDVEKPIYGHLCAVDWSPELLRVAFIVCSPRTIFVVVVGHIPVGTPIAEHLTGFRIQDRNALI